MGIDYNLSMFRESITTQVSWGYRLQLNDVKGIDYNLSMLKVSIKTQAC
jgi:hypothetical protein